LVAAAFRAGGFFALFTGRRLAELFRVAERLAGRAEALAVRFSLRARAGLALFFRAALVFAALAPADFRLAPLADLARLTAPLRLLDAAGLCRFVLPLFLAIAVSLLRSIAARSVDEFL
jgi:hypothetical protein